jgi:adenosylmethionine-8-amino-7-oxononanoate aminotransferase
MVDDTLAVTPLGAERATAHLWPHSSDDDWPDLVQGGALRVLESGQGCMVVDTAGRRYLDGFSGLCVVNVGHGRAEIGAAMAWQAARLAYIAPSNTTSTA